MGNDVVIVGKIKSSGSKGWQRSIGSDVIINYLSFNDKLTLKYEVFEPEKITLNITNFLGQDVYSVNGLSKSQEIDISFLPGGVYLLRLQNSSGQKVFKILKE